jgi:hypothetical protein
VPVAKVVAPEGAAPESAKPEIRVLKLGEL